MLHNLFVREHNAICDHLKEHPRLGRQPAVQRGPADQRCGDGQDPLDRVDPGDPAQLRLDLGLNANWYGMLTYKFRKPEDRKTVADFNVSNPELGGLVGNKINKHGSPFGLTEEFVEVYRLHSLLPETLIVRDRTTVTSARRCRSSRAGRPDRRSSPARGDGQPVLLVRQPAAGRPRAEQLPPLHAGAEHSRQPGVRHGRDRHPAGPRAWRPALQRVPAPARTQPDPHASTT